MCDHRQQRRLRRPRPTKLTGERVIARISDFQFTNSACLSVRDSPREAFLQPPCLARSIDEDSFPDPSESYSLLCILGNFSADT